MVNYYQIKINGIKRKIASFDKILKLEQGYIANGADLFTDLQYLSSLFINLGYNKCPSTIQKILNNDICDVEKTEVFDYRITGHNLYIKDKDTLDNLINCIKIWIYGKSESGYIVDINNSFKLPDKETIEYNLNNQIEIKRSLKNSEKMLKWHSTDYYTRRLHNITSNINPNYFDKCIRKFKEYAKKIEIENCHLLFKISLINPDVLYTAIRNAEITSAEIVNKKYNDYSALRPDYDTVLEFINQLNIRLKAIIEIYNRNGLKAFLVIKNKNKPILDKTKITTDGKVENIDDWYKNIINDENERMAYINNIKLNSELKKKIYSLIDSKNLPPDMTWSKCCNSNSMIKRYKLCYESTMKALYYILETLVYNYEDLDFNSSEKPKLILSKSFYVNPHLFSIYWKEYDMVFVIDEKYNILEMEPKEAIKFYSDNHDINIRLDSDDFITESKEPEDIKIVEDEISKVQNNDNNLKNENASNNDISSEINKIYVKESEIFKDSIITQDEYGKFGININNLIKR